MCAQPSIVAMFASDWAFGSFPIFVLLLLTAAVTAVAFRIFYNLYWHPAAKFPGPWYCAVSSFPISIISVSRIEPKWLQSLVKKYGSRKPFPKLQRGYKNVEANKDSLKLHS
jgi:hypothetical protein